MFANIIEKIMWIFGLCLFVLFCAVMYRSGQHAAREDLCAKVNGVYVQTYTNGWKCIQATIVDLK